MGRGNSYVSTEPSFNFGKATVIEALQDELGNEYIKFPESEAETRVAVERFAELSELPNTVGTIDGFYVQDSAVDWFSRYQQHDFLIQALVNGKKLFLTQILLVVFLEACMTSEFYVAAQSAVRSTQST